MTSAFSYTPGRRYWKQAAMYSNGPENTIYIGGVFEKVSNATITDYHHLIPAGSATVVLIRSTGTNNPTYYVTRDPLRSSAVVTNSTGAVILNASFAAYGGRRGSNWTGSPTTSDYLNIASTTRQGFTGHTMLDNLNLIHMNGRVFDSEIGRFVSADPMMDGTNTQTINPYRYVGNNPLSAIDPTGFIDSTPIVIPNGDQDQNGIPDPFSNSGSDSSGSGGGSNLSGPSGSDSGPKTSSDVTGAGQQSAGSQGQSSHLLADSFTTIEAAHAIEATAVIAIGVGAALPLGVGVGVGLNLIGGSYVVGEVVGKVICKAATNNCGKSRSTTIVPYNIHDFVDETGAYRTGEASGERYCRPLSSKAFDFTSLVDLRLKLGCSVLPKPSIGD